MHTQQYGPGDYERVPFLGDPADPRWEGSHEATREEQQQTLAAHYWDKDVGDPIRPERFMEALAEIANALDKAEAARLAGFLESDTAEFGQVLANMIMGYLQADCEEKAREAMDKMDREAEAEAAMARMKY